MILESSFWKDDLLKLADKLQLRIIQKRWGGKNIFALEKDLFIGFYAIRKLIESEKISDSVKLKQYRVSEFEYRGSRNLVFNTFSFDKYKFDQPKKRALTISQICNQFIHSFYFLPSFSEEGNLIGFYICSDHQRIKSIFLITIFDIIDIYNVIGNNYPSKITKFKSDNGNIVVEIE